MSAPYYLILTGGDGPAHVAPVVAATNSLSLIFSGRNVGVWASDHAIGLGRHGAVIGHLFTRATPSRRVHDLDPEEVRRIVTSRGATLIRDFWGGYVAIIEGSDGAIEIVRDPSGAVPVYWRRAGPGICVAPEMGIAPFSRADGIHIDADALALHLWSPNHGGPRTCLAGVSALIPGEVLRIANGVPSRHSLWSPWDFVPDREAAAADDPALLRATVVETVRAWGGCFAAPAAGLSGGLDSSIVSAGLAAAGRDVCAYTMVGPDGEGDETAYARRVAEALPIAWEIAPYRLEDIDLTAPIVPHSPTPFLASYAQSIAATRDRLAGKRSVDAFFSGDGGDNVFCLMRSVAPLLDRLASRASPAPMLGTLLDIAHVTEADIGTIVRMAFARWWRLRRTSPPEGDASFLDQARLGRALAECVFHPWLVAPDCVLPGKAAHVRMIARAQGNDGFHSRRSHPPSIAPLLSQPIVELCLAIPTWRWIEGGIDRSVARRAFKGVLPDAVLTRRSKGGPSGFMDRIYRGQAERVQGMLRESALVDLGIVDAVALRAAFGDDREHDPAVPRRLLSLAAAEAWARFWS